MGRLDEKHVFITGAATGIGKEIAFQLAKEGAVISVTDKNQKLLDAFEQEIKTISPRSKVFLIDVTDNDSIKGAVAKAIEANGRIDVLVNNAGVSSMAPFDKITDDEWDLNMDVNLKGVWRVIKEVVPRMRDDGKGGKVVCTASMAAKLGAPLLAHYSASKFGVIGLVQAVAKEVASYGITVNAVCPGFVKTDMQDREIIWEAKLRNINDPEAVRQEYIDMTPMGRLCLPEDVAKVVLFLATDDSGFMTGQSLNVTGGVCVH